MIDNIDNKKILFFSPAFFGYENKIKNKMEEMGAKVDCYDERSITSAIDKALLKISPKIFENKSKKYYENIINENKEKDYDYILIVKCDMTPKEVLQKFKEVFPKAKLCLYLWDSVKNNLGIEEKFQYFDSLHSFDLEDCKIYRELKFRPLFYADQFKKEIVKNQKYEYDISFLGTIHSDRYLVLKQIQEIINKNNLKSFYFKYLQSNFIYYFYKLIKKEFKGTKKSDFDFSKMSSEEIANIVDKSKIILDIQHPKQTGLTMRTIEMIGMNKKIITTNETIKEYDFYNSNNISIIDRKNVNIDLDFFKNDYEPLDKAIYEKYSLEAWIKEVLS